MEQSPYLIRNDIGNRHGINTRRIRQVCLMLMTLLSFLKTTAQWQPMPRDTILFEGFYSSVRFVSGATGFLVGCTGRSSWDSEGIFKTNDGGATWSLIGGSGGDGNCNIPSSFVDENLGYCILSHGTAQPVDLMQTTNGGSTWTKLVPGSGLNLGDLSFTGAIYFFTGMLGFIAKEDTLYRTSNGGADWQQVSQGYFIRTLFFTSAQTGYAAGDNIILKTTDAGLHWLAVETDYAISSLSFPSVNVGYAVGAQGTIIKTEDAGNTWTPRFSGLPVSFALHSVAAVNDNLCFAVGDSGTILHTANGGNNWNIQNSGLRAKLNSISCTATRCYAVGDTSVILETTGGSVGMGSAKTIKNEIVIFPNPCSKEINVKMNNAAVTRTVMYDAMGRKYEMKYSRSGQGITISRGTLPAGIYFIRLMDNRDLAFSGKVVIAD